MSSLAPQPTAENRLKAGWNHRLKAELHTRVHTRAAPTDPLLHLLRPVRLRRSEGV